MNPIATFPELSQVEGRNVVVSTFVAEQKHSDSIQWLFNTFDWLHTRSGGNWHIIVPVQHLPKDRPLQSTDYNYELADQLRNSMGVPPDMPPCLVFDNFIDESPQFGVRLPYYEKNRAALVETVADFIDARIGAVKEFGIAPNRETRRRTTGALENYLRRREQKDWTIFVAKHGLIHGVSAIGIALVEHFVKWSSH
jgi:hypothetical protein